MRSMGLSPRIVGICLSLHPARCPGRACFRQYWQCGSRWQAAARYRRIGERDHKTGLTAQKAAQIKREVAPLSWPAWPRAWALPPRAWPAWACGGGLVRGLADGVRLCGSVLQLGLGGGASGFAGFGLASALGFGSAAPASVLAATCVRLPRRVVCFCDPSPPPRSAPCRTSSGRYRRPSSRRPDIRVQHARRPSASAAAGPQ